MRVPAPSFTITGATGGSISEPNATSTTNGRFYGVVAGTPRPFRETGLEPEDAVGQPATIPRWDGNPERINFESLGARNAAGTLRTAINVDAGQGVSGLTGVIDYAFRNWRFTIDFDAVAVVTGSATAGAVSAATPAEYTVASYNLERFFDDNNDPALSEPVLTPAAFANRLAKASRASASSCARPTSSASSRSRISPPCRRWRPASTPTRSPPTNRIPSTRAT